MSETPDSLWDAIAPRQQSTLEALKTVSQLAEIKPEPSPSELLFQIDKMTLKYFAPKKKTGCRPLLICYALVNRPYILDLEPERSLIQDLNAAGVPVYLIDWGYPDITDKHLGLEDYIFDYLDSSVSICAAHAQTERINLMGVCQGGVFSLIYAAAKPAKIDRLIALVTPVDTEVEAFTLARMIKNVDVAKLVSAEGNLKGSLLNQMYGSLKPLQQSIFKSFGLSENLGDKSKAASFLRMEHWINDSPDLAGKAATEFAEQLFKTNGLMKGSFCIGDRLVNLEQLVAPVLNIFGEQDHLVPPASSRALRERLSPEHEYKELGLAGGHIGAFVSQKSRAKVVEAIVGWIADR